MPPAIEDESMIRPVRGVETTVSVDIRSETTTFKAVEERDDGARRLVFRLTMDGEQAARLGIDLLRAAQALGFNVGPTDAFPFVDEPNRRGVVS